jgi:hypothetical protein
MSLPNAEALKQLRELEGERVALAAKSQTLVNKIIVAIDLRSNPLERLRRADLNAALVHLNALIDQKERLLEIDARFAEAETDAG